jgi:EAL domain-containing protein (putative c-di-GMP-specific phosphodiesterase class I)
LCGEVVLLTWKRTIHAVKSVSALSKKRRNRDWSSEDRSPHVPMSKDTDLTAPLPCSNSLTEDRPDPSNMALSLHTAWQEDQLCLRYQAQYDMHNGGLRGFDALLCWNHPELGFTPSEYLPLAEDTRLLILIGAWAIQHACETLSRFAPPPSTLSISVNISVNQLMDEHFIEQVQSVLERTNIHPSRLELVITYNIPPSPMKNVQNLLIKLQQLGVLCALGDYGKDVTANDEWLVLPLHSIKIYKGFAQDIGQLYEQDAIEALFGRIRQFPYKIVVEGIESYDQLSFLKKMGCDYAQGSLFSQPLSEDELPALLQSQPH